MTPAATPEALEQALAEFQRRNGYHRPEIEELLMEFGELVLATATAEAASLRAEVEAKDRRIAELSETWTDEGGTVWSPPTAWAYAKACVALNKHRADAETMRAARTDAEETLRELVRDVPSLDWMQEQEAEGLGPLAAARTALARAATAGEPKPWPRIPRPFSERGFDSLWIAEWRAKNSGSLGEAKKAHNKALRAARAATAGEGRSDG